MLYLSIRNIELPHYYASLKLPYRVCVYIVYKHRAIPCTGFRRQTGTEPYGDCAEIVPKSYSHRAIFEAYSHKSIGARVASVARPRGDGEVTVRSSLCTKSVRFYISDCAISTLIC